MKLSVIGVDLAKEVIQVKTVTTKGKINKAIKRAQFLEFMNQQPRSLIGMEACGSAHYWARKLQLQGHTVKLMHPAYVTPFVMGQKNDMNDASACRTAVIQDDMRFVPIKTIEQQDIQMVLRIKERLEKQQTALVNQIRGLLREYGIYIPQGIHKVFKKLPEILEDGENELTMQARQIISLLGDELRSARENLQRHEEIIQAMVRDNELCQIIIKQVRGIGPITALTLVNDIADGSHFKNGRHLSAWIGLVPRQYSSGGITKLGRISKRGSSALRRLLFMGARSVIRSSKDKTDKLSLWVQSLLARHPHKKVAIAVANKMARMAWAVLNNHQTQSA